MTTLQVLQTISLLAGLVMLADFLVKAPTFFLKLFTGKYSLIKARPAERALLASDFEEDSPLAEIEEQVEEAVRTEEPVTIKDENRDPNRPITLVIAANGSRSLDIPPHAFDRLDDAA